ncbi:sterol desaturase family protein [Novosphingobium bradum]|uniref:Sterol desaturase family protein n=1 Tax=Novosphingobium bradum TaxID=1737444 RepID=A0ABV7IP96_9SPHN
MTDLTMLLTPEALSVSGIYQWKLALLTMVMTALIPLVGGRLLRLAPGFRDTARLNREAAAQRKDRANYMAVSHRSGAWGILGLGLIFVLAVPLVATTGTQSGWKIALDVFIVLMVYDFFYYLVHRFLFHDGGFGPGPLLWVHATHHQQHNPCRMDSSYLNPIENLMGQGLYAAVILALGLAMGGLDVITIIITAVAFIQINLHNHDRQDVGHWPYRYLKYATDMHHVHHKRFDSGNFATISLFYDWLFGSLDTGQGWGKNRRPAKPAKAAGAGNGASKVAGKAAAAETAEA